MSDAIDVYLNDHLAGASAGVDLTQRLQKEYADEPLGDVLAGLAKEIEQDRSTLADIMAKLGVEPDPIKQAAAKIAERVSRFKLGGGARESGRLLALESLSLGIEGKACLWLSLAEVADRYGALSSFQFDELLDRATSQRKDVERERLAAAAEILAIARVS